jgi:hypothetical protein
MPCLLAVHAPVHATVHVPEGRTPSKMSVEAPLHTITTQRRNQRA